MTPPKHLTQDSAAIKEFLDKFDTFLFDCDGVLWTGDHVFPGIPETLHLLRALNKRIVFVTNNSTKSRADYAKKIQGLGIEADEDDVFGSSYSSAVYIARIMKLPQQPSKNKVFVIGEAGVEAELRAEGVPFVGGTDPNLRRDMTPEDWKGIADGSILDPEVGAVLCALDFHINYLKLSMAFQYLQGGAKFLSTNMDSTLPIHHALFPGSGSLAYLLVHAMGGKTPMAFGKPNQAMMDAIEGKFQLDRARTCMVGDRLNTDIQFGIEGKLGGTLAVLTGVNKKEDWEAEDAKIRPAYYVDKLSDLRAVE